MKLTINFYRNLALLLLVVNFLLLASSFWKHPLSPPLNGPIKGEFAKKMMDLTPQQQQQFIEAATRHRDLMRAYNQEQSILLEQYFLPLTQATPSGKEDSLLTIIQDLERKKIASTYQHFEDVKAFLNQEQYAKFQKFTEQGISKLLRRKGKAPQ